jgi:hypothetical protein
MTDFASVLEVVLDLLICACKKEKFRAKNKIPNNTPRLSIRRLADADPPLSRGDFG